MKEQVGEMANASPRLRARIAGVLYLFAIAMGIFALFTTDSLFVSGEAASTANNILASEQLYRFAFAARLIGLAAFIAMTSILYSLLKPVNGTLALTAAFFSLAGCVIHGMTLANHLAPLFFLGDANYLTAFDAAQLQALARVSIRSFGLGFNIGLVFFGFFCITAGWLIFRSTFMPKIIGALLMIGGVTYLIDNFTDFLALPVNLYPYNLVLMLMGDGSLALWLTVFGVNANKWKAQAGAPALV